jgi:hypothetical protein
MTTVAPLPSMPPGALASAAISVDAPARIALSSTGRITTLRISGKVQPVSSYGFGLAGA